MPSHARPRNTAPRARNVFNSDSKHAQERSGEGFKSIRQFYRWFCFPATFSRFAGLGESILGGFRLLSTSGKSDIERPQYRI